jgi:hypothetical protein
MRFLLVLSLGLLCAVGCGDDDTKGADLASVPRCAGEPNQGGLCSPDVNTPCMTESQLYCSCECGYLWICGLDIACDMGTFMVTPRDLSGLDLSNHD